MSFTSQRASLSSQLSNVQSTEEYMRIYLSSEIVNTLQSLAGKYIYHLYNDLLGRSTTNDLKVFLNDFYGVANDYAKECLSIVLNIEHLHGYRLRSWTDNSLQAFNCFIIKLINDKLKERIPLRGKDLYETDAYHYLINKGAELQTIGQAFQSIYQMRNEFTHLQYEDSSGKRQIKRWSNKKFKQAKELIVMQYGVALAALDNEISK